MDQIPFFDRAHDSIDMAREIGRQRAGTIHPAMNCGYARCHGH
jgi:hypothetical protein